MSATQSSGETCGPEATEATAADVTALIPMVRRIVYSRVGQHPAAEDLVQEALARVLAASATIEPGMLEPYTITTTRNLIATMWRDADRSRQNQHRAIDPRLPAEPESEVVAAEEQSAVLAALTRLSKAERELLLAHEVTGAGTRDLAAERGSTPGAVAAQLHRARARMRVEYLLVQEQDQPPTSECRPVLLALSAADRRRQREVDAAHHLLECQFCARLSEPLTARAQSREDEAVVPIATDADIVSARQAARELASRLGFASADLTILATAVSEVARNIVRFAEAGEITIELCDTPRRGVRVVARDAGPGIADVEAAMQDGFSTYDGLGLGLPGVRRLMDEFTLDSEPGRGTTVTMTKWQKEG